METKADLLKNILATINEKSLLSDTQTIIWQIVEKTDKDTELQKINFFSKKKRSQSFVEKKSQVPLLPMQELVGKSSANDAPKSSSSESESPSTSKKSSPKHFLLKQLSSSSKDNFKVRASPATNYGKSASSSKSGKLGFEKLPYNYPLDKTTTKRYREIALENYKGFDLGLSCEKETYEILVTKTHDKLKYYLVDYDQILGEGVCATLHPAWDMDTKKLVVAKVYKKPRTKEIEDEKRNLLIKNRFLAYFSLPESKPIILMNYVEGKDLIKQLYPIDGYDEYGEPIYGEKKTLAPWVSLQAAYKLLEQVSDFHETLFPNHEAVEGLLHRDIKSANCVIDISRNNEVTVALIDLTDALPNRKDGNNSNTCCGSNGYVPPELIGDHNTRKPFSKQSDIYAMGVTIAELITVNPFQKGIQRHLREFGGVNFNDHWQQGHLHSLMPDVFLTQQYHYRLTPSQQSIQDILYKHLIFPVLCDLVKSMTALDPLSRLENSSLEGEIRRLKILEKSCLTFTERYDLKGLIASVVEVLPLDLRDYSSSVSIISTLIEQLNLAFKALLDVLTTSFIGRVGGDSNLSTSY